jgi:ubiquinone/menaquinone biosynthesis C-methylase UbiE
LSERSPKEDWEVLAEWYDKKQGESGDLWHRSLIDPVLVKLVGDVSGKDILDLGCGNGYLSRRFAKNGARVSAVDSSPEMIRRAIAHDPGNTLGISYAVSSAGDLTGLFQRERFDIVFANMTLMDFEDAAGAIRETSRVLRDSGRFVASISHPCFDNGGNSAWVSEKLLGRSEPLRYRRIRQYRRLFSEMFPWRISETERGWTRGYHRPLSWYASAFKSSGLAITALEEPEPTKEFFEGESDAQFLVEVPLQLVLEAVKL